MIATSHNSISSLLQPASIRVGLRAADKREAIGSLVDLLSDSPDVLDLEQLRRDVLRREAKLSTGVGSGIGLPHARSSAVSQMLLAFAVTAEPLDFEALDGEPVRLILLLVGPKNEPVRHVRLLGRISRLLNTSSFRAELVNAETPEAILDVFQRAEEAHG